MAYRPLVVNIMGQELENYLMLLWQEILYCEMFNILDFCNAYIFHYIICPPAFTIYFMVFSYDDNRTKSLKQNC